MLLLLGRSGFLGQNFKKKLEENFESALWPSRQDLDLSHLETVREYFNDFSPQSVILVAGRSGGIGLQKSMGKYLAQEHLIIQNNVFDAAQKARIPRLVFFASSCLYPRAEKIPLREEQIGTGDLEESSKDYALAKLAGIKKIQSARKELSLDWITIVPSQIYGPFDHFHANDGHVIASLFYKFYVAKKNNENSVSLWGDGKEIRDFFYVEDLVEQVLQLLESKEKLPAVLNLGSGLGTSIYDLAHLIAKVVGYSGDILFNNKENAGAPYKVLDITEAHKFGLKNSFSLEMGLQKTWDFFQKNQTK